MKVPTKINFVKSARVEKSVKYEELSLPIIKSDDTRDVILEKENNKLYEELYNDYSLNSLVNHSIDKVYYFIMYSIIEKLLKIIK